jgi:hypothetical protein
MDHSLWCVLFAIDRSGERPGATEFRERRARQFFALPGKLATEERINILNFENVAARELKRSYESLRIRD